MGHRFAETWDGLPRFVRTIIVIGGILSTGFTAGLALSGATSLPRDVKNNTETNARQGEFHDSVRVYMRQKDRQDARILCYLRSMANETSAVDCG